MIAINKLFMLSVLQIYLLRSTLVLLKSREQRGIYLNMARVSGFRAR
jgi:hypothetical protein